MSLPPRQKIPPPTTFRAVVRVGELGVARPSVVEYWPTVDALVVFEDYPEPTPSAFPTASTGASHAVLLSDAGSSTATTHKPPALRLQLYGVDVLNCRAYGPSAAQAERGLVDAQVAREAAQAGRGSGGAGLTLGCLKEEPTTADCVTLTPDGYRESGNPAAPRLPPAGVLRVTYAPGSATRVALVDTMTIVFPRERQHHHRPTGGGDNSNNGSPQRHGIPPPPPPALAAPEDMARATWNSIQAFRRTLMKQAYPHGPQHFVVLMSPVSGRADGLQQWDDEAVPLLRLTPHTYEVITTEREGHAETIARTRRFEPTDVIVAGGGDGMLHEVLNGLRTRHRESESPRPPDSNGAFGGNSNVAAGFEGRAFGIATFPVGSGCAASKALGVHTPFCAARALARGSSIAADVLDVVVHELPKGPGSGFVEIGPGPGTNSPPLSNASFSAVPSNTSFAGAVSSSPNKSVIERSAVLGVTLGMLASVDLDSDKYRWAGKTRFTLEFLKKVAAGLPSYRMRVRVRPAKSSMMTVAMRDVGAAAVSVDGCGAGSHFDTPAACTERQLGTLAAVQAVCPKATLAGALEVQAHRERVDENAQPAALAAASSSWVELHQRDFCLFGLHNSPWLSKDINMAPYASVNDGTFDLCYSTPALGRANVVSLFSGGGDAGNHVNADVMRYMKLTGIEIKPMSDDVTATIDGGLLSSNPDRIVVTVAPHRIRTVCWAPVTTAPFDAVLAVEKQQQAYSARFGSRGGLSSRDGLSMLNESCPSPVAASPVLYEYFAQGA